MLLELISLEKSLYVLHIMLMLYFHYFHWVNLNTTTLKKKHNWWIVQYQAICINLNIFELSYPFRHDLGRVTTPLLLPESPYVAHLKHLFTNNFIIFLFIWFQWFLGQQGTISSARHLSNQILKMKVCPFTVSCIYAILKLPNLFYVY